MVITVAIVSKKRLVEKRKEKRKKRWINRAGRNWRWRWCWFEHVPEDGGTSNNVFAVSWFCDIGNAVSSSAATLKIIFSRQVGNANDRTRAVLKAARFAWERNVAKMGSGKRWYRQIGKHRRMMDANQGRTWHFPAEEMDDARLFDFIAVQLPVY